MDPMALLDMERRTGIATKDVDDFVNRMDLISKAMEQIKDGTFDPEACQIPGYKSPAQEAREAEERARKEQERRRKAEEKKQQEKTEEKEQWWKRAKLRFALERGEDDEHDDNDAEMGKHDVKAEASQWANRVLAAYKARDANDYSVWNNWVPEDPATLEEKAAREAALEKMRNDEFEKNNPEFCQQFRNDLEKRQQTQREREREAEKFKLVGNRHYKRREYEQAIAQYMKALEKAPFNVAVLTNIAQSYLRLEELDDSVEFSTRALYVNPDHVKALSRRAAVWHRQHKWEQAAQDMEKALQLDPENEDVVEQHSIVVGDYEDSITQSQLGAMLTSKTTGDVETAAELRFILELLSKIDEQEKTTLENNEIGCMVLEAWMGYQLLVPCLERNSDARDFMRTSGELAKLTQRLLRIIIPSSFEQHLAKWTEIKNQQDAAMMAPRVEEITLTAMIHVLAVCLTNSPRNQVVQYRDTAFRHTIVGLLASSEGVKLTSLPAGIQEQLLRVVEEVIDSKAWKKEVIASTSAIRGLLDCVATPLGSSIPSSDVEALTKAAVSASSILFTISGDDPHGLKALTAEPSCLKAIADGLQSQRRSTATLSNMLGVLTNLSTIVAIRSVLDAPNVDCADDISMLRSRLVRSLLVLSTHFTKSSLSPQKRSLYQVCAERALAALLNFTFQSNSPVRIELIRHDVLAAIHAILEYVTASDIHELMVIISRTVSLLCRLHSLEPDTVTTAQQSLKIDLTSRTLLDKLYQLCELSLPSFAATATSAASSDLWQTHAQIWCHVGWCISIAGCEKATRAYLEEKQALPAMIETLDRVNTQRMYHRGVSEAPTSAERIAGNIVKVLIAMLPQTNVTTGAAFWSRTQNLQVLVDALQNVPDGLARKNVAILLAKLCQIFGDAVKDKVRALRGIEMMLTVSKSLSTPRQPSTTSKPKAVAF